MNMRALSICLFAAFAAVAGCSRDDTQTAPVAGATAYVAVARGRIDIEGGLLSLTMPVDGTLTTVAVHEGDHVHRGQVLAALDTRPAQAELDMVTGEMKQARARETLLGLQLTAARELAQRETAAAAAGAGSGQSADVAQSNVAQLKAQTEAARAAIAVMHSRIDAARYTLARDTLHAPIDADVINVRAQPGASVSAQSAPLFTLLPQRPYIVRAELNATYLDAVHAGMRAEISADDNQAVAAGTARVLRVGKVFGPATLEDDPGVRANARTVDCVLVLDRPSSLRVGQRVLVRFLPDKTATKG
jgi:multidrug resistance efflux pump